MQARLAAYMTALGAPAPVSNRSSELNLLGYAKGIVYLDAQVADRALQLRVTQQKLQALRLPVLR